MLRNKLINLNDAWQQNTIIFTVLETIAIWIETGNRISWYTNKNRCSHVCENFITTYLVCECKIAIVHLQYVLTRLSLYQNNGGITDDENCVDYLIVLMGS